MLVRHTGPDARAQPTVRFAPLAGARSL